MFSKTGLVNLKFFALLVPLLLTFAVSFLSSIEQMMLNGEIVEMTHLISESQKDNQNSRLFNNFDQNISLVIKITEIDNKKFIEFWQNENLILKRDITPLNSYFYHISILIYLSVIGILIVIFFSSKMVSRETREPIIKLNRYIKNINERSIEEIPIKELPEEFHLLAGTLNELLRRINNFIFTQKELFIGASHELKTPLSVIKLKNQVTLLKKRSVEEYIEVLKLTNQKIDEMNRIVSDVLNIGRQETAQFEPPVERDVIKFLSERFADFQLLAESQDKILVSSFQSTEFYASIQETLLHQVIQNFLQNALKFTPKSKKIELTTRFNQSGYLIIEVIDEGIGVDEKSDLFAPFHRKGEKSDLFAPFHRKGEKSGVGLGLFIAKSAADAMGSKIYVKNRTDGIHGTVAGIELKNCPVCNIVF